jgi:hypothetical protein
MSIGDDFTLAYYLLLLKLVDHCKPFKQTHDSGQRLT